MRKIEAKFERCRGTGCEIPFMTGDKVLWCKHPKCPETSQRYPTEEQRKELKLDEPFKAKQG